MNKLIERFVLAIGGLTVAGAAFANAPATSTVGASLTIGANCHITASSTVNFNTVDPTLATDANGSGSIDVKCTKGTTLTDIKLDAGGSFTGGSRRMTDGTDFVAYSLYKDSSHTIAWGDDNATINASSQFGGFAGFTSAVVAQNFPIYGLVLATDEDVPTGAYSDTVNVTVDF